MMNKEYLTTFQAAKLLSVTPDAVLKWIKSGKLLAYRTPGGHYRIKQSNITKLLEEGVTSSTSDSPGTFEYCWEFNALKKNCQIECEQCMVYKARAKYCYKMSEFPAEFGSLQLFCESSCDECEYYKSIEINN